MSSRQSSPHASERTPLLSRVENSESGSVNQPNGAVDHPNDAASISESLESTQSKKQKRWPTVIALTTLCLAVLISCFGFALPSVVEEYAKEAVVFEPTNLSIDSFASFGVRARVQGTLYLDAKRVGHKATRELGRFGTWIAREVQSGESEVKVYLPEYDNVLLGTATIPPVKVNIRNHHENHVDILADLEPGDMDGVRRIVKNFMDRKLKELTVNAVATLPLRSVLIRLPKQRATMYRLSQMLKFGKFDLPSMVCQDTLKV